MEEDITDEEEGILLDSNSPESSEEMDSGWVSDEEREDEDREDEEMPVATYDRILPISHSYLGENLEVLRGRTFYEDGAIVSIPLYPNSGYVIPNQTLPLAAFDGFLKKLLQYSIEHDRIFGVISGSYDDFARKSPLMGTTVEIYEYLSRDNVDGFKMKGKARQRFKILGTESRSGGIHIAKVEILPEIKLPSAFNEIRLFSLDRHRKIQSKRCERTEAALTAWPAWVFGQYNPKLLVKQIKNELKFIEKDTLVQIPEDPSELSFWMAQNLPIGDKQKLKLLRMNSPIQRLRLELSLLKKSRVMCCINCKSMIGKQNNMFSMSVEGPQGTFCNPSGFVHDVLTFYQVIGLYCASDPPSEQFSWYPGYAWSIAYCQSCTSHIGWKFTAVKENLKPEIFWGLCQRGLIARNSMMS